MRDASKARGVEHTGVFERRATPLAAMQRWSNALVISRRALSRPRRSSPLVLQSQPVTKAVPQRHTDAIMTRPA